MPTNYTGRIVLIVTIMLAALWVIFPRPHKLFDSSASVADKINLKPGIDMVGGTSLLYEIKATEGSVGNEGLAEQVMASLKKRVDPDGVRNLIWRPQGNTRLEIQMPLTGRTGDTKAQRLAFAEAQRKLEETNVAVSQATDAVDELSGDERRDRLNQLAGDSKKRAEVFGAMASIWDQIKAAREAKDSARQAELEEQYDALQKQIEPTNLSTLDLQTALDQPAAKRDAAVAAIKQRFTDFPWRIAAIDQFAKAYREFAEVKEKFDTAEDLKRKLRGSGVLEFHILVEDWNSPEAGAMIERLEKYGPRVQAGDTMKWAVVDRPEDFGRQTLPWNDKHYTLLYTTPDKQMVNGPGIPRWGLEQARREHDQFGIAAVGFTFDAQGAQLFSELTRTNVRHPLAIVLDNKVISAPNINEQIGRSGIISGGDKGFSNQELDYLVSTLSAGSLPAQLSEDPISERTVGPQLGADNLRAGFIAGIFGLIVVAVFLIAYYYLAGVVATFAVILNLILLLGAMAALNATFTLAGIAGIVLGIGMAVDANVLIFERLREEQLRGLSVRMAVRNAYDRAFSAIVDSNVTTAITAALLYTFGSEEVKGFGLTLLLGIVSSMFTALFVTRTIYGILIDRAGVKKFGSLPMTFPKWDQMLKPNIDWMGKAAYFWGVSIILIVSGLIAFGVRFSQDKMLDIEFASGTAVQFRLKEPMKIEQVRDVIESVTKVQPDVLPAPQVVSVEQNDRDYEVVTPNPRSTQVREALLTALRGKLDVEEPSHFTQVGEPLAAAIDKSVIPITADTITAGQLPAEAKNHLGGVAVLLRDLQPALTPEAVRMRIERQRLQPATGTGEIGYLNFNVLPSPAEKGTVVVLASDPNVPFDRDAEKWRGALAQPLWQLINDGINKPAELQRVTNFDAQVAGEAQGDAFTAVTLSIIAIVIYIWMRFGDLTFGMATVIALLHDTLFTLAAVGIAHYVANTAIGNALLIEPFRVNLNLVAAVLTVMGYSMNDTVVVFDRIRENRGKFGVLDRKVINDSINQTLSRTLLTGGTTILTILVMYIIGGPGIHGFTFVLLFGILVGTYSSIAIAAPILLLRKQPTSSGRPSSVRPVGQLQRA